MVDRNTFTEIERPGPDDADGRARKAGKITAGVSSVIIGTLVLILILAALAIWVF
jgi:hypothetical protein